MLRIKAVSALEILDSRGRPTLQTTCELDDGAQGVAAVPSGASTGAAEALELRDRDPARYGGLGVRQAVAHVNTTLHQALQDQTFADQATLDEAMIDLDGTPNKSRLGANAILGVSLAFARAAAQHHSLPLYHYFAQQGARGSTPTDSPPDTAALVHLPRPTINLFSGGKHAGAQVAIQDVLVVAATPTVAQALEWTYAVYQAAARLCETRYNMRALTADEGGLAPPFPNTEAMLVDAVQAIEDAGFTPGRDIYLAVDVASSHFYHHNRYHLDDLALDSAGMIDQLCAWVERFPIVSLEDGLAEEDWDNWPRLRAALAGQCLVLGDDFLCTNPARIARAIESRAADALLLKVNQIGTLTEAAHACHLACAAQWAVTVSARSGETEDNWLADLAVGWGGDQLKVGSITQSERLAKYNRLLTIEAATGLPVTPWPNPGNETR